MPPLSHKCNHLFSSVSQGDGAIDLWRGNGESGRRLELELRVKGLGRAAAVNTYR